MNWCRNNNGHSHILSHYTWKYRMSVSLTLSIISLPPSFSPFKLSILYTLPVSLCLFSLSFSHSLSLLFLSLPLSIVCLLSIQTLHSPHYFCLSLSSLSLSLLSFTPSLSLSVIFSLSLSDPPYSF